MNRKFAAYADVYRRALCPIVLLAGAIALSGCQTTSDDSSGLFADISSFIASQPATDDQVASIEPVAFRPDAALQERERELAENAAALRDLPRRWQCVPFARELSGIDIYGNAWTWWASAEGRYERGHTPIVGSVLVLSKTRRNVFGHVAVVREVVNSREIIVDHANWGWSAATRGRVNLGMHVMDVSENNDWSVTRFWSPVSEGWGGRDYPAYGFIYADPAPQPTDALLAAVPEGE